VNAILGVGLRIGTGIEFLILRILARLARTLALHFDKSQLAWNVGWRANVLVSRSDAEYNLQAISTGSLHGIDPVPPVASQNVF